MPALKIDGRKVQGSRNISRELDVLKADPPLFPADPQQRAAVEEAERWGDEEFQQMARTITWWALKRHKSDQASFLDDAGPMARLGMPTRIAVATSGPILAHRDPPQRLDRRYGALDARLDSARRSTRSTA